MVATPTAGRKVATAAPAAGRPVKLFVGGLTRNTTTKLLREHFGKYGRILDCVAMCQADGKPRGFGYVTLDSPAAADHCLSEPQIIDGRVVDMKRAVPAHGKSAAASGRDRAATAPAAAAAALSKSMYFPPGAWDPLSAYEAHAYASQVAAASAWGAWGDFDGLDCLEVLRRGSMPPSPCEALNLLSEPSLGVGSLRGGLLEHRAGAALPTTPSEAAAPMSAAAPEFVPQKTTPDADEPQKVAMPSAFGARTRSALGDITNTNLRMGDGAQPAKAPLPSAAGLTTIKARTSTEAWLGGGLRAGALQILADAEESGSESAKENAGTVAPAKGGLTLPPGLALPPGLEDAAASGILSTVPSPTAAAAR